MFVARAEWWREASKQASKAEAEEREQAKRETDEQQMAPSRSGRAELLSLAQERVQLDASEASQQVHMQTASQESTMPQLVHEARRASSRWPLVSLAPGQAQTCAFLVARARRLETLRELGRQLRLLSELFERQREANGTRGAQQRRPAPRWLRWAAGTLAPLMSW